MTVKELKQNIDLAIENINKKSVEQWSEDNLEVLIQDPEYTIEFPYITTNLRCNEVCANLNFGSHPPAVSIHTK